LLLLLTLLPVLLLLELFRAGEFGADMERWICCELRVGVLERGAITDPDITSSVPSNQLRPLLLPLMVSAPTKGTRFALCLSRR
jgi:hypothetical protein